jgi:hypothetical protein
MNPLKRIYDQLPDGFRSTFRSVVPDPILRWYAHLRTDVIIVSYPKCGRTWLRLMVGRTIASHFGLPENEDILFLRWKNRPHPAVPHITVIHDDRPMLKSPTELESSKVGYHDKKVVFLVRDPRDVVVSSYYEMKNRGRIFGDNPYEKRKAVFDGSLSEFIHQERGGFETILRYYNIWAENRDLTGGFLLVRYEDMKNAPKIELRRVIDFLGLGFIPDQTLAEAVEYASFDNMRKMESEGKFSSGILNPADKNRQDSYKTRKGKVKGYLEYLDQVEVEYLNRQMRENLSPFFGYIE